MSPGGQNLGIDVNAKYIMWALRHIEYLKKHTCTIAQMSPAYVSDRASC